MAFPRFCYILVNLVRRPQSTGEKEFPVLSGSQTAARAGRSRGRGTRSCQGKARSDPFKANEGNGTFSVHSADTSHGRKIAATGGSKGSGGGRALSPPSVPLALPSFRAARGGPRLRATCRECGLCGVLTVLPGGSAVAPPRLAARPTCRWARTPRQRAALGAGGSGPCSRRGACEVHAVASAVPAWLGGHKSETGVGTVFRREIGLPLPPGVSAGYNLMGHLCRIQRWA